MSPMVGLSVPQMSTRPHSHMERQRALGSSPVGCYTGKGSDARDGSVVLEVPSLHPAAVYPPPALEVLDSPP